ncbi:MAG: HEAT repeat domain-containing protein [Nitrospirae bacterium]|nr:MAG: HEAT repeat domain-containing protein [Nitrospirota bacterium]
MWLAITLISVGVVLSGCQVEAPIQDPMIVTARLVDLLHDPDPEVRRTAALSLGKIGHSAAAPALVQALREDPDPVVREYSAWALGEIGDTLNHNAKIHLVQALGDESIAVKQAAATALGKLESSQEVMNLLSEVLIIGGRDSRRAAVKALMDLDGKAVYPALVQALSDSDPQVRQGAVAALGELGDPRARPLLRRRLLRDPAVGVRAEAAYRLGLMGDRDDLPALQRIAQTDPTPLVHLWATWAIQRITG